MGDSGAWALISFWILAFNAEREAMRHAAVVGALLIVLAIWALDHDPAFDKLIHRA